MGRSEFWGEVRRFILWFPPAAGAVYTAVLGITSSATAIPIAQAFAANQFVMWQALMLAPYGIAWLFALVAVWLGTYLLTGHMAGRPKRKPRHDTRKLNEALSGALDRMWRQPPPATKTRMPLHRVVRWIARDSVWAAKYQARDDEWITHALDELQVALSRGEIAAEGFRSLRNGADRELGVRIIPKEFWAAAQWRGAHNLVNQHTTFHAARGSEGQFNFIELDEADVKRRWPKRSAEDERNRRSPVERIGDYGPIFAAQDELYWLRRGSPQNPFDAVFGEDE